MNDHDGEFPFGLRPEPVEGRAHLVEVHQPSAYPSEDGWAVLKEMYGDLFVRVGC